MGIGVFLILIPGERNDDFASTQPFGVWKRGLVVRFEISNTKWAKHLGSRSGRESRGPSDH